MAGLFALVRAVGVTDDVTRIPLLIVGYGPTWMKPLIYGTKPQDGLTARLLEAADAETKELLGIAGWM